MEVSHFSHKKTERRTKKWSKAVSPKILHPVM